MHSSNHSPQVAQLLAKGQAFHQRGQFAAARDIYERILKRDPAHVGALHLLGTLAAQTGNLLLALECLDQAISVDQTNASVFHTRGQVLKDLGRLSEARASIDHALAIRPDFVDAHASFGNVLADLNQLEPALASYDRAIALGADLAQLHYNRGNVLVRLGRMQDALASFDRAKAINPDVAQIHANRGTVLKDLHQLHAALESYDRAIALNAAIAEVWYNRGVVLAGLGHLESALASYDRAVTLNANHALAHYNRANVLNELKRFEDALAGYDLALSIKPDFADACCNRAKVLIDLRRFDAALASAENAIAIQPDLAEAYCNRGNAQVELKQFDTALASYDRAIAIRADYAEAHYNRGNVLKDMCRLQDAAASYRRALECKPDYCQARWALAFVTIPPLFARDEDRQASRLAFANELEMLDDWFDASRMNTAFEAVGSSQPFYLAYQELDNKPLLQRFGGICRRLMAHWEARQTLQPAACSGAGKIRIGIVSHQIQDHSVWNAITKGWLLHLDPDRFEVHVFHTGNVSDAETALAQARAITFTQRKSSLGDWAKAIVEKKIEALIYPEVGMNALTAQLANLRLAPLQMAAWGHPETTGLPTIDWYLSAELLEPADATENYTERLLKLPNLGCSNQRLPVVAASPDWNKLGFEKTQPILLCPGTHFKYAPEHDWVLAEICRRLGACKLVFFSHQEKWASVLKERLREAFEDAGLDLNNHAVFIPWLKREEFYGLMQRADVYLDTIGFSGFNTAMQAVDCALPIVTRESQFLRGRLAAGILRRLELPELIADTDEDYISLAVRMAQDGNFRTNISRRMQESRSVLYEDQAPIRAFEDFLLRQCRAGGGAPLRAESSAG